MSDGTFCPQCPHPISQHSRRGNKRGARCLIESCGCLLLPPLVPDQSPPVPHVDPLPQDQRTADLAEPAARLVRMGHAEAVPYLYAAWAAGFTARDRTGKGTT
jgi:hypothetical protein